MCSRWPQRLLCCGQHFDSVPQKPGWRYHRLRQRALLCAARHWIKHAAVLCSDAIPARYAFTNARLFKGEFEPQTVVAVDVASVQLFGENNGVPQYTRHVDLCIDHHAGNSGYADVHAAGRQRRRCGRAAVRGDLCHGRGTSPRTLPTACTPACATDTGCFKFSSTKASTHITGGQADGGRCPCGGAEHPAV